MNAQVDNPFGKSPAISKTNAVANAEAERSIQEVQAAMVIAKKFPRDQVKVMDDIINACTRESLANAALYCYPRGGEEVTGPSIRLAEAIAQHWGNIQFGIRELSADNGVSHAEAFAWDIEKNTREVKNFIVPHVRYTKKKGAIKLTDSRDIYELVANYGARRMRACILGVIPGDVTEAAQKQCEITQQNAIEVTPQLIKQWVAAFEKEMGVNQELLERKYGKRAEAFNPLQILNLNKIYRSIKDGMSKPSDWFDIAEAAQTVEPKTADLGVKPKRGRTKKEKPEEAPEREMPEHSPAFTQMCAKLEEAENVSQVDELLRMTLVELMTAPELGEFRAMADEKLEGWKAKE